MPTRIEALGLSHLNTPERLALIEELWGSLEKDVEAAPLCPEAIQEIERRLAEHAADPSRAVPWEEVQARTLARLRNRPCRQVNAEGVASRSPGLANEVSLPWVIEVPG